MKIDRWTTIFIRECARTGMESVTKSRLDKLLQQPQGYRVIA
jgi:hypothetical protein